MHGRQLLIDNMEGVLGQLLSSLNPLKTRRAGSDSAVERLHTVELLFPTKSFTQESNLQNDNNASLRATQNHDCSHGDIDVDFPRDVRFLIAQAESASSLGPVLLFDSKQPEAQELLQIQKPPRAGAKPDGSSNHTRTASGTSRQLVRPPTVESIPEQEGRESPTFPDSSISAIAHRNRLRRTSTPATQQQKQEATSSPYPKLKIDDVVQTALDCMFDNVASSYKGDSSNFKVYPIESQSSELVKIDPPSGPPPRRTSHLSNVFSAADFRASVQTENANEQRKDKTENAGSSQSGTADDPKKLKIVTNGSDAKVQAENQNPKRRTVMITRTFSVPWTQDDAAGNSSSLPKTVDGKPAAKPRLPPTGARMPNPPMFSVTLLLDLPIIETEVGYPLHRNSGTVSLASSAGKEFNMMDSSTFGLDTSTCSVGTDVDSAVEMVTSKHWDIVIRTLSSLQKIAVNCILSPLRQLPARGRAPRLLLYSLAGNEELKKATHAAGLRLIRGFNIPRVETGQRGWGNWRDEARVLGQWADGRDKNFLFSLMNAFLGTHTEWLNVMAPLEYRTLIVENQRLGPHVKPEDLSVSCRTVVVSAAATTSRRMVYLLSIFLPANKESHRGSSTPYRPGTAQSYASFSQSPPTPHNAPSRNESLRRSTMKRQGHPGDSRNVEGTKTPHIISPTEVPECRPGMTIRFEDQTPPSRRGSDTPARPPKSPTATGTTTSDASTICHENRQLFSRSDSGSRPSSADKARSPMLDVPKKGLPTNSAVPAQFAPMAYISGRPPSRDSIASENLMSTLQRTSSSDTQSSSRWASLKSFWNGSSSRPESECFDPLDNDEGVSITGAQHSDYLRSKLQQMVLEGEAQHAKSTNRQAPSVSASETTSPAAPVTPEITEPHTAGTDRSSSQPVDIPKQLQARYNVEDGVVDVIVPFPSPPALSSPPFAGYYSAKTPHGKVGRARTLGYDPRESDRPLNVAGVLNSIHPDFALQAVAPYKNMVKDIKAAMSAEPIPVSAARRTFFGIEAKEAWVEVCTTLIIDTRNLTVTRLRLRRKVRFVLPTAPMPAPTPSLRVTPGPPRSHPVVGMSSKYGNPYKDLELTPVPTPITVEEEFIEEKVDERDAYLTLALERVLAQGDRSPKVQSATNSRASSRRGSSVGVESNASDSAEVPHSQCRVKILSSLHQITARIQREQAEDRKYGSDRLPELRDAYTSTLRVGIEKWFDDVNLENRALTKAMRKKERDERAWYNDDAMTIRASDHKKAVPKKCESEAPTSGSTTPTATSIASQFLVPPLHAHAQAGPSRSPKK